LNLWADAMRTSARSSLYITSIALGDSHSGSDFKNEWFRGTHSIANGQLLLRRRLQG
jgi:hypothetical protein